MIVIDPDGEVKRVKYSGDVQLITKEINCELFDIVSVRVGSIYFQIFVDDEGLFRNLDCDMSGRPRWNIKATHLRMLDWLANKDNINWPEARKLPPLAGRAVILMGTDDGDTVDLDDATNEFVLSNLGEDVTMEAK